MTANRVSPGVLFSGLIYIAYGREGNVFCTSVAFNFQV